MEKRGLLRALRRLPTGNGRILSSGGISDYHGQKSGGLSGMYSGRIAAKGFFAEDIGGGAGMKTFRRIFLIVIDSLGIGEMPDAADYGDAGADTLGHISECADTFDIPNLQKLGMANLKQLKQVEPLTVPEGYYAALREASASKDTMTGHWEMMGLKVTTPFKTFTENGFPADLIDELERRTGHKVIGNKSASGTVILDELGEEEIATGNMIVYTSADSVLQICGNEETFDLKELYRCCEIARELTMREEWKVGRVIARPYVGKSGGNLNVPATVMIMP